MATIKLFLRYIKQKWFVFVYTIFLFAFLNFIRSIIPKLSSSFISIVSGDDIYEVIPKYLKWAYSNLTSINDLLLTSAILIVIIAIIRDFINIVCDVNAYRISEFVGCEAQNDYFKKVQDLPYSYLNHAETGDLIQRSMQDINRFKRFITGSSIDLINSLFKLIIFGVQMLLVNVEFSLYIFTILPVYFISSFLYFKAQSKDFTAMEEKEGKMTNVLQENLTGIRIVKSFANEEYEINKFNNSLKDYTKYWKKTLNRMSVFWGISDILTYVQLLLVFILSIYFYKEKGVSFPEITQLFIYTEQIAWPCRSLGRTLAELGKTSICCNRIIEILDKKDEYQDDKGTLKPDIKGDIEFKDVSFRFADSSIPTLSHINLHIKAGETIAIVGKTGCGKSTFINLLNRLLDPTEGKILLDGVDITSIDKHYVRSHVGVILQEPFLYSRTIGQNINITLPYDDAKKSKELASIASVSKDIEEFEKKYDTVIGERGVTLSGGQKQRIAIARMLASKKEVLVFDDSLSAVDSETDLKIRNALKSFENNCTTIIITHRIVTAKDANRIIVFENGRISAIGSHEELIKQEGLYQKIWKIQNYFNDDSEVTNNG